MTNAAIQHDAIKKEIDLIVSKIPKMGASDYKRAKATIERLESEGRRFDLDMEFLNGVIQREKERRREKETRSIGESDGGNSI